MERGQGQSEIAEMAITRLPKYVARRTFARLGWNAHAPVEWPILIRFPSVPLAGIEVVELRLHELEDRLLDNVLLRASGKRVSGWDILAKDMPYSMPNWSSLIFCGTVSSTCSLIVSAAGGGCMAAIATGRRRVAVDRTYTGRP